MQRFLALPSPLRWILLGLCLAVTGVVHGQANGNGPCAVIITYKADPLDRPAFRRLLAHTGIAQFEAWRKDGVIAGEDVLFSVFANQDLEDATVVLHFDHFSDIAKWTQVERSAPGGLKEKIGSAGPVRTEVVDLYRSGASKTRDPAKGVSLIIPYSVPGSIDEYRKYVDGYVVPQMEGWIRHGVLSSYALYLNQNGAGAKWDALLIQEYNGYEGLAQRETTKDQVRKELAESDPVWKNWSLNKTKIRTEGRANLNEPILP